LGCEADETYQKILSGREDLNFRPPTSEAVGRPMGSFDPSTENNLQEQVVLQPALDEALRI
jgi:hypothetical protein